MNTCQIGNLSKDFSEAKEGNPPKKLIPVIYCHGLTGTRTTQTGSCQDLASHGYIVFTMSHTCGTANFARMKNGEEKYWTSKHDHMDIENRRRQLKVRLKEVQQLIEDISDPKYPQKLLGFPDGVTIDMEKLVLGGHSFGGMTAIEVARHDERVKVVFSLDPWLWCSHEEISSNQLKLKQPMCFVISEAFPPLSDEIYEFSTEKVVQSLIDNGEAEAKENIVIKEINHYH